MKQLRKILPIMLILLLALGLFGCGSGGSEGESPAAPESSASEDAGSADTTANAGDAEEPVEYEHGSIDGTVYTNDFFGFTFTAKDSWTYSDEEQLRSLNQSVSDILDNDTITDALKSGSTFIDMQASDADNPMHNINLTISYDPNSSNMSDINDATLAYMKKSYEDAGFENVSLEKTTASLSGDEVFALLTKMTVQGIDLVEKQVFLTQDGYLGTITVSGSSEEECDELLGWLSK